MASNTQLRLLSALWILLSCLSLADAQSASPANVSSALPQPGAPQMILKTPQTSMITTVDIDPLTNAAGYQASTQTLQAIHLTGRLILTDPSTVNTLARTDIAFISCDTYPGALQAGQTITYAANQTPVGIVLYSNTSHYCTVDAAVQSSPTFIYTMTDANASLAIARGLQTNTSPGTNTTIYLDESTVNNGTGNNDSFGASPTTAVAMIILYSITGIITALFLVIIVTGAIRAHRHPERYGPRNVLGRPRQSRARGIARAMLETLPIVKFGETEDQPKPATADGATELGENRQADSPGDVELGIISTGEDQIHGENASTAHQTTEGPEHVTTVAASGSSQSQAHAGEHTHEESGEAGADQALACSVCTDDFIKGQDIRVLPCKHKFHPECIDPWLLNVSGTCPLCRVDLRPTVSHHDDSLSPTSPSFFDPHTLPGEPEEDVQQGVPDEVFPEEAVDTNRTHRVRNPAAYIRNHLSRRRMGAATPEERIATLRDLRNMHRASQEGQEGHSSGERTFNIGARLSRVFRGGSRADPSDEHPMPASVPEESVNGSTPDGRRVGTFAE